MSEEYHTEESYSPFWPLLVLLVGLVLFFGFQTFVVNSQRAFLKQQLLQADPVYKDAVNWQSRFSAMMKDLNETAKSDQYAAQIFKEAVQAGVQAGLITVNQNQPAPAAGGSTNAAPAAATPPAAPAK